MAFGRGTEWPAHVEEVLGTLETAGFQAFVVGGGVRDRLLGRPCHDYDIATDALPAQVAALFERTIPTGVRHGTVTVLPASAPGMPVEVTTFRVEDGYSDGRHPDRVRFTDRIEADLARRDFTINAMAMDRAGHLVDPFGGAQDLVRRRIRAVGEAGERFTEDGLRILRGLRFAAELGFAMDPATQAAMEREADRLGRISLERIGQELARIAQAAWGTVADALACGSYLRQLPLPWPDLYPGFARLAGLPKHLAAWPRAVRRPPPWSGEERQASSLAVWAFASGCPPQAAAALARSVRWPVRIGRLATRAMAAMADDPAGFSPVQWRFALWREHPPALAIACRLLDWWERPDGPFTRTESYESYAARQPLRHIGDLAVDGRTLAALGLQGPAIGQVRDRLVDAVLRGDVANDPVELIPLARRWAAEAEEAQRTRKEEHRGRSVDQ
ncbi:CCA tRNA nucleotidyltransferase [Alicyclobacillus macrosporangiidus]|uniref:CCA tRNA nucleotidyltransferase n=1 Tax=Alicyclobacillus macrosporangiidus TaxID=392015 RepID=UPI000690A6B8|nr:CCA tRNA nucleotidyltransferase [Alicyclobacillus macrosporangiidus]